MEGTMLLALLSACTTPTPETCTEGGTGTLHVTLDLPDETWVSEPALAVYASDGTLVATVTDPESSLDLPVGLYTVAARRGTVDGDLVGRAFVLLQDTVQQVCVSDGEITDWSGTWELQPSSGKLWMTSVDKIEERLPTVYLLMHRIECVRVLFAPG